MEDQNRIILETLQSTNSRIAGSDLDFREKFYMMMSDYPTSLSNALRSLTYMLEIGAINKYTYENMAILAVGYKYV